MRRLRLQVESGLHRHCQFRSDVRTAGWVWKRKSWRAICGPASFFATRPGDEGSRCHPHPGVARIPPRAADRQPPAVRRVCGRTAAAGDGCRKGKRRHLGCDALVNPAPVRPFPANVPPRSGVGRLLRSVVITRPSAVVSNAMQPRKYRHLGAHMPWRAPLEQPSLFFGRQLGNRLQIQINARCERCPYLLEGRTVDRDVEVDADCLPAAFVTVGVASEDVAHPELLCRPPVHDIPPMRGLCSWPALL